jgi:hypothetical protein
MLGIGQIIVSVCGITGAAWAEIWYDIKKLQTILMLNKCLYSADLTF